MSDDDTDTDLARDVWRELSEVALDRDRKIEVSRLLDMSWTRVLALRRLASGPLTQRALAGSIAVDPPYITVIVDDLEQRRFVRREPHPQDRRSKLVQLSATGRAAVARAERILYEPPAALREAQAKDLAAVLRVLEHLRGSR